MLRKREKTSEQGFLFLPDSPKSLQEQMEEGVRVDIAVTPTGQCIGFLLSYPGCLVTDFPRITWVNPAEAEKYGSRMSQAKYIYLDQIGVSPGLLFARENS